MVKHSSKLVDIFSGNNIKPGRYAGTIARTTYAKNANLSLPQPDDL
ncbi:MAG: hypothetical protein H0V35_13895 [Nitrospira sp.]|nr:hypothetical protein [Nitrospira sp.]